MRIVATFDPSLVASDTFNAGFSNGTGKMVVYNESSINLQLAWGAFSTYCPAWTAMLYCVSTNNVNISWQQQSQLASNQAPISLVIVEAYDNNESVLGTYPAPLVRQTNIGNASTVLSAATSIQNDGNVAGSNLLESTVMGDVGSAVDLTNDGHLAIGTAAHPGSVSFDHGNISSDGTGKLTVVNRIIANLMQTQAGNDLTLNAQTGHKVAFQAGGGDIVNINASGLNLVSGKMNLLAGAISRIAVTGQVTLSTAGVSVAHGLGATPDFVIVINDAGGSGGAVANAVNYGTMDGTHVTIYSASGSPVVRVLSLKF